MHPSPLNREATSFARPLPANLNLRSPDLRGIGSGTFLVPQRRDNRAIFTPRMKKRRSHFSEISTIPFEGPKSDRALAFRHYNPDELVDGKPLSEHLRFSIAY